MKKTIKKIFALVLASLCIIALVSCTTNSGNPKEVVVTVGVCGPNNKMWYAVQKVLDEQNAGIKIKLQLFDAYTLPNEALNSKDIDLNAFQHIAFLNNEIKNNKYDLTVIGTTLIAPLTLYSKNSSSLLDLKNKAGLASESSGKDKAKIAVPDDATNLARAIKLLEKAGLIEVDPKAGYTPELSDITKYVYNIEIVPQTANTLPSTLTDYAAAAINGTYAVPAGLVPSKDGLIIETSDASADNPYVNVIVARTADKDNEVYKKVVEAYHSQLVAEYILAAYEETYFPVFDYNEDFTPSANLVSEIDDYWNNRK